MLRAIRKRLRCIIILTLLSLLLFQELAAKVGLKAEFEAIEDDSSSYGKKLAVKVLFGNTCLGHGPPAQNKKEASRLASQAVLSKHKESDIFGMI